MLNSPNAPLTVLGKVSDYIGLVVVLFYLFNNFETLIFYILSILNYSYAFMLSITECLFTTVQ